MRDTHAATEAHRARPTRFAIALGLVALIAVLGVLSGCAPEAPSADPDIVGVITTLDGRADGASLLVEATQPGTYDIASVFVGEDATVLLTEPDGLARATFVDIANGAVVEVWFEGPVAESYPVQATAGTIVVLGY